MKLPFIIYRNSDYRLFVNNHRVKIESDKNGQLVINKDNKSRVKVEIEYLVPTFHKILLAVSIISVLFNIIVLFIIKFWNNRDEKLTVKKMTRIKVILVIFFYILFIFSFAF